MQVTAPCWQHAPKIGQGLGKQGVPVGCSVQPMNGQVLVFAKTWQTPVALLQHVALGGMQGLFGTQVEPTPCQMPVHTVWACTKVQMNGCPAALLVQHAPHVGIQVAGGRQVPPAV